MKWIIPYQGRNWVFDDARITASEARLQKRITGGATPAAAGGQRFELDPDVFVAALAIARKRAGLELAEAISIDDDELDLTAIVEATEEAIKATHTPIEIAPVDDAAPGNDAVANSK